MSVRLSTDIEPRTKAFLDELAAKGGPPIQQLSPTAARAVLTTAQAGSVDAPEVQVIDRELPTGPAGKVYVRIVRPRANGAALPVVMYFHGGGWVLGDAETHQRLVAEVAVGAQAAVVFVKYSRAPEAQYPIAIEEAYAATRWIAENGPQLDLDSQRLAVAGDSVGGNMAAAVTLMAKERSGPAIEYQVLFYPVTDASFDTESYRRFAEGHFLTLDAMKWFWDQYAPDIASRSQPTASPLRASLERLRGLPPALIITGEFDVLRDEGEAYAHRLAEAGVRVTATRYLGTIHDFVMLNAITDTPPARAAIAQATGILRRVLAPAEVNAAAP